MSEGRQGGSSVVIQPTIGPSIWWIAGGTSASGDLKSSIKYESGLFKTGPELKDPVANHCGVAGELSLT